MSKMVPYHAESAAFAQALCRGCTNRTQRWNRITQYVSKAFAYDYVRAATVPKRNGLPDVDRAWKKHMGICLDISAMTVGMLRSVGISSNLVIGLADGKNHAWVEATVGNRRVRYDHGARNVQIKSYKGERIY